MISDVSNKVVVITGSSRGLGRSMAIAFAREGAKVVINFLENHEKAHELLEYIKSFNNECILVCADVTKERDVKRLYETTISRFGKVDVLINNVGINSDNYLAFMQLEQWNNVINTNLNSVYLCSRFFSMEMIRRKSGKIINVASLKGQLGSEGQCNYSASKAGVIAFTKSLAKELGDFNISVNAVCPGFIITDLNKNNLNKKKIAEEMSVLETGNSLKDLENFIIFLASDCINGVSGQTFNVDSRIDVGYRKHNH